MKENIKVSKTKPENAIEGENGVTIENVSLVAVSKMYKSRSFYAVPIYFNELKRRLKGAVVLSPKEMELANMVIEDDGLYVINNGDRLRLLKDKQGAYIVNRDFVLYNLYLIQPEIAPSSAEIQPTKHLFYLNNTESLARANAKKKRLTGKAYAHIDGASVKEWSDMLYYFQFNPLNYSAEVVESKAYDLAETQPAKVVEFFENRTNTDRIVFVQKLLAHKLLTKDRNGYLLYDSVGIGLGEEAAANFLYDSKNDKIFTALRGALDAREGYKEN